jgi:tyrosinase
LNYDFDPSPGPPAATLATGAPRKDEAPVTDPQLVAGTDAPLTLVGQPVSVGIAVDGRARQDALAAVAPAGEPRTILNVDDIEGTENPGTAYGIYVNLPQGAPPEIEELHFVGTLSFFGIERAADPAGDEPAHNLRVSIDITETVAALKRRGLWGDEDDEVRVSLHPLSLIALDEEAHRTLAAAAPPAPAAVPPVTVGRISVFVG